MLKQIEPGKTGPKPELNMDAHNQLNRQDAAEDVGMSKHQMVQAIRVANVPEPDFSAVVEAEKLATVTAIAEADFRLANEYDAAQERGEVGQQTGRPKVVPDGNDLPPAAAVLGLSRKDFTPSERVAIARAVEAAMGERRGRPTEGDVQEIAQLDGVKTRQIAPEMAGFGNPETYCQAKGRQCHRRL